MPTMTKDEEEQSRQMMPNNAYTSGGGDPMRTGNASPSPLTPNQQYYQTKMGGLVDQYQNASGMPAKAGTVLNMLGTTVAAGGAGIADSVKQNTGEFWNALTSNPTQQPTQSTALPSPTNMALGNSATQQTTLSDLTRQSNQSPLGLPSTPGDMAKNMMDQQQPTYGLGMNPLTQPQTASYVSPAQPNRPTKPGELFYNPQAQTYYLDNRPDGQPASMPSASSPLARPQVSNPLGQKVYNNSNGLFIRTDASLDEQLAAKSTPEYLAYEMGRNSGQNPFSPISTNGGMDFGDRMSVANYQRQSQQDAMQERQKAVETIIGGVEKSGNTELLPVLTRLAAKGAPISVLDSASKMDAESAMKAEKEFDDAQQGQEGQKRQASNAGKQSQADAKAQAENAKAQAENAQAQAEQERKRNEELVAWRQSLQDKKMKNLQEWMDRFNGNGG